MHIYFIRHGETHWNKSKRLQGRTDIPLNDYGRELATITSQALSDIHFDKAYTSPLVRAIETCDIILNNRNLEPIVDDRIVEISFGDMEGDDIIAIYDDSSHPMYNFIYHPELYSPPPSGESFEDLNSRCKEFIEDVLIPLESSCHNVLVVAHGALIRGIIRYAQNLPLELFWEKFQKNCAVTTFSIESGYFQLIEDAKIYY